jgi:hypothetical protein
MPKRTIVPFPENFRRPEALADWLELSALHAADQDASMGDAQRELDRLNCGSRESLLGNVLTEFDRRERAAGRNAYPFERGNTSIHLKGTAKGYPAYFFCLALSYYGWRIRKGAPENPWLLFEELSFFCAKNYLGGNAILFGTSARQGTKGKNVFRKNVEALAKELGEGQCFASSKTFAAKDSKLDIVAWKGFEDKRPSQVIIFGQCKAGGDWRNELTELDPNAFWDQWLSGGKGKVSQLLRSVFVPHRVFDDEEWDLRARWARLLFDRCRIVSHAHSHTASGKFATRLLRCCRAEWQLPV